jgi:hypothetical protein
LGRPHPLEYPTLSAELPGGGWPVGALVELLLQQAGVGEVRLLRPALGAVGKRPIALLHVKRRGPTLAEPLSIALQPTSGLLSNRRRAVRSPFVDVAGDARSVEPAHA